MRTNCLLRLFIDGYAIVHYPINGIKYVHDEERMAKVATQFAQSSCGIMNGCIRALDGWVVKIKKPTRDKDNVSEPSSFYSRKGYFGLNVQCIVDKQKRVLFRTIKSRGAEHDSTAFKNNKELYVTVQQGVLLHWRLGLRIKVILTDAVRQCLSRNT